MSGDVFAQGKERAGTPQRLLRGVLVGLALFAALGTVTAVWPNPFFIRMTPVGPWELGATTLTALFELPPENRTVTEATI